jgi:hypothetical protein
MTNLTLLKLAAIAIALDEEGAERKWRRWAVHPSWSKREIEGEFVTLYKELIDDEVRAREKNRQRRLRNGSR